MVWSGLEKNGEQFRRYNEFSQPGALSCQVIPALYGLVDTAGATKVNNTRTRIHTFVPACDSSFKPTQCRPAVCE